jgi:hypothetical protein
MTKFHFAKLVFLVSVASGCVTKGDAHRSTEKLWLERSQSQEFLAEKNVFKQRLGGKELCARIGIKDFTWASNRPSKDCIYSAAGYFHDKKESDISQLLAQLKVMQVAPEGFIMQNEYPECVGRVCTNKKSPDVIFVHKSDETGVVDGSFLDSDGETSGLYIYEGPYVYKSAMGQKTVHSFRKFSKKVAKDAFADLKIFNPNDELLAESKLWDRLAKSLSAPPAK